MQKIKGVKMFQSTLDFLKLYQHEYSHFEDNGKRKLSTAALSCYILFHYQCDDFGRIPADELNLKAFTRQHELPYSSIHKGFHQLLSHKFISSEIVENREYYVIGNYEENNSKKEGLNYFLLPFELLESDILSTFIKARDTNGLLGVLELCNGLSRDYQQNRTEKKQKRTIIHLLKVMKKSVRNIMCWVKRIKSFFNVNLIERGSIKDNMIEVDLPEECFITLEGPQAKRELAAATRKEIASTLTTLPFKIKTKEQSELVTRFLYEVVNVFYWSNPSSADVALRVKEIISHATDTLTYRLNNKTDEYAPIKSPLSFWIGVYREKAVEWYKEIMNDSSMIQERLNLNAAILKEELILPFYLKK